MRSGVAVQVVHEGGGVTLVTQVATTHGYGMLAIAPSLPQWKGGCGQHGIIQMMTLCVKVCNDSEH